MSQPVEGPADLTPYQRQYLRNLRDTLDTPPTFGRFIAHFWRHYVLVLVFNAIFIWLSLELGYPVVIWLLAGMFLGAIVRDHGFFSGAVRLWPVTVVIIDRNRVDELLGEPHDRPDISHDDS